MGLDNGIVVVNTSDKKNLILKTLYKKCDKIDDNSYDVCYWRGCWNIRNKIFSLFDSLPQSQIYLSIENVNEIVEQIEFKIKQKPRKAFRDVKTGRFISMKDKKLF